MVIIPHVYNYTTSHRIASVSTCQREPEHEASTYGEGACVVGLSPGEEAYYRLGQATSRTAEVELKGYR